MPSTSLTFADRAAHRAWLAAQAAPAARLPRRGRRRFEFTPFEVEKPARMKLALLALDRPTEAFAAVFTRNAFPGAPVLVGRRRLGEPRLGAVLVNNKISNVCAPGRRRGLGAALRRGGRARSGSAPDRGAAVLHRGHRLAAAGRRHGGGAPGGGRHRCRGESILPAAEGIMTTDLYPKVRRHDLPGGASHRRASPRGRG